MKIEVDLNELLGDEYGNQENIADSICRQISSDLRNTLSTKIDKEIEKTVQAVLAEKLSAIIEKTAEEMLDAKYVPVSEYGKKEEETCLRDAILKSVTGQMVYKRASYDSDKNTFTRAVDGAVQAAVKSFEDDFKKEVTDKFRDDAIKSALETLNKKFSVKI